MGKCPSRLLLFFHPAIADESSCSEERVRLDVQPLQGDWEYRLEHGWHPTQDRRHCFWLSAVSLPLVWPNRDTWIQVSGAAAETVLFYKVFTRGSQRICDRPQWESWSSSWCKGGDHLLLAEQTCGSTGGGWRLRFRGCRTKPATIKLNKSQEFLRNIIQVNPQDPSISVQNISLVLQLLSVSQTGGEKSNTEVKVRSGRERLNFIHPQFSFGFGNSSCETNWSNHLHAAKTFQELKMMLNSVWFF